MRALLLADTAHVSSFESFTPERHVRLKLHTTAKTVRLRHMDVFRKYLVVFAPFVKLRGAGGKSVLLAC